jgi:tRNA U34 2-thiouridine synthase MnmA/TrmU
MNNINFINFKIKEFFEKNDKLKAKCKIRYRQEDQDCEIIKLNNNLYKVKFIEIQRAIASGQICAVYI